MSAAAGQEIRSIVSVFALPRHARFKMIDRIQGRFSRVERSKLGTKTDRDIRHRICYSSGIAVSGACAPNAGFGGPLTAIFFCPSHLRDLPAFSRCPTRQTLPKPCSNDRIVHLLGDSVHVHPLLESSIMQGGPRRLRLPARHNRTETSPGESHED